MPLQFQLEMHSRIFWLAGFESESENAMPLPFGNAQPPLDCLSLNLSLKLPKKRQQLSSSSSSLFPPLPKQIKEFLIKCEDPKEFSYFPDPLQACNSPKRH
jgi:hypothetical protein